MSASSSAAKRATPRDGKQKKRDKRPPRSAADGGGGAAAGDDANDETKLYLLRLATLLKEEVDPEERALLVDKAHTELLAAPKALLCDRDLSRMLEELMLASTAEQLAALLKAVRGEALQFLTTNCFGSRALEAVLHAAQQYAQRTGAAAVALQPHERLLRRGIVKPVYKALCADLGAACFDSFASYVVRAMVRLLGGYPVKSVDESGAAGAAGAGQNARRVHATGKPSQPPTAGKTAGATAGTDRVQEPALLTLLPTRVVLPRFAGMLRKLAAQLLREATDDDMLAVVSHPKANPTLQALLAVLPAGDATLAALLERVIAQGFEGMMTDSVASRLLEVVLARVSDARYSELYTKHFRGKLLSLAQSGQLSHYVVQGLFSAARAAPQVDMFWNELSPHLAVLLGCEGNASESGGSRQSRPGLVWRLVDAAARHNASQAEIVKQLRAVLSRQGELKTPLVLLLLGVATAFKGEKYSTMGGLMVNSILQFQWPANQRLIESYAALRREDVLSLALDAVGSRAVENFLTAPIVQLKQKRKLIELISVLAPELAVDKYGSRTVEKAFEVGDVEAKREITAALAAKEETLQHSNFARFCLRSCRVSRFRETEEKWAADQTQREKKRAMFADILNTEATVTPRQFNKKKTDTAPATTAAVTPLLALSDSDDDDAVDKNKSKKRQKKPLSSSSSSLASHSGATGAAASAHAQPAPVLFSAETEGIFHQLLGDDRAAEDAAREERELAAQRAAAASTAEARALAEEELKDVLSLMRRPGQPSASAKGERKQKQKKRRAEDDD